MDPTKSNGEWSASEIEMAKSLITRYNNNKSYAKDMNKKHGDIINEIKTMFPLKEENQIIGLYIDLTTKMIQSGAGNGSHHSTKITRDLVNNNFEDRVEDLTMQMGSMRVAQEVPSKQPTRRIKTLRTRIWTKAEHRLFLHGLHVYGRGNWKNISKYYVITRTPLQISKHAQEYFQRLENATHRQQSINDVGIYDAKPWAQNNTSGSKSLAIDGGAHNPNKHDSDGKHATINNLGQVQSSTLYHASEASNISHSTIWDGDQRMGATSSSARPTMEGAGGTQVAWAGDRPGDVFPGQMMNMDKF